MDKIIFVAGLDNRAGDLVLADQEQLVKKGYPTATVISFRYNAQDQVIKSAISSNTDASVLLFSAGCAKSEIMASHMKSLGIPLSKLYINEPYTILPDGQRAFKSVNNAISLGVPAANVFSGAGFPANGGNIVGSTKTDKLGRKDHWNSVTVVSKIIFEKNKTSPSPSTTIPVVDFNYSPNKIKTGESVTFTNKTTNSTEFLWSAIPNTNIVWNSTTASNPKATFNSTGTYSISLQAKNSFGTVSFISPVILSVTSSTPPNPPPAGTIASTSIDPSSVTSKIKLVKKEGPGEIVGVVEVEVTDGYATFAGIQIDEPGTYIIEAIPSNPDLEKVEFEIVVEPEPSEISQEKKSEEEKPPSGDRPIIAQIDEPNQKIPPLKRDIQNNVEEAGDSAIGMGLKPLIGYNGAEAARDLDIKMLKLYYEDNVPKCQVQFRDSNGLLADQPPRDDTKFEIFLNSTDELIKSIHLVFKIKNHKQSGSVWTFEGAISVDDWYVSNSKSYEGTSFEVLRKICKELNLGYNSNIDNTNDSMKWININQQTKDFIKQIIEHSYKDEKTFLFGYLDFYYCFNYVDIEKEWQRDISGDFAVETSNLGRVTKDPLTKIVPLLLTNEQSQRSKCNFFENFKIRNQSTSVKLKEGYRTIVRYYDEKTKSFLEFEVDSQSSTDGKTYVLKGEAGSNEFLDKKVEKKFLGNIDTSNVHKNYLYAKELNRKNLDNLTSIVCDITMPNVNYNLYKFQKVKMNFHNFSTTPTKQYEMDFRYTGEWMIIDISYELITSKKGSRFEQKLTLVRKELGKNPDELAESAPAATAETKEGNINNNELTPTPITKPNSKYKVGDLVQVVRNDGTKYEIEITSILENGNEVQGKMKKI